MLDAATATACHLCLLAPCSRSPDPHRHPQHIWLALSLPLRHTTCARRIYWISPGCQSEGRVPTLVVAPFIPASRSGRAQGPPLLSACSGGVYPRHRSGTSPNPAKPQNNIITQPYSASIFARTINLCRLFPVLSVKIANMPWFLEC